jgi:hypothetical protein
MFSDSMPGAVGDDATDVNNTIIAVAAFVGFVGVAVGFLYMMDAKSDTPWMFQSNVEKRRRY